MFFCCCCCCYSGLLLTIQTRARPETWVYCGSSWYFRLTKRLQFFFQRSLPLSLSAMKRNGSFVRWCYDQREMTLHNNRLLAPGHRGNGFVSVFFQLALLCCVLYDTLSPHGIHIYSAAVRGGGHKTTKAWFTSKVLLAEHIFFYGARLCILGISSIRTVRNNRCKCKVGDVFVADSWVVFVLSKTFLFILFFGRKL